LAVAVFGGLLALAAGAVFYVVTDNGTVEIESADPAVAVVFEQNGKIMKVNDPTGKQTYVFDTGKWSVRLEGGPDGLEIELPKEHSFDLKRGGKQVVSIRRASKLPERVTGATDGKTLSAAKSKHALAFDQKGNVWVSSLNLDSARPLTLEGYFTMMTHGSPKPFLCTFDGIYPLAGNTWGVVSDNHTKGASIQSAIPVRLGKRTHVAAVFTGRRVVLFVDGEVAVSQDYEPSRQPGSFHIGGDGSGGTAPGLIEEVRVSSTARYDKTFTPAARFEPDADTMALYHFDEGTGEVLKDESGNGHHGKINGARWVETSAGWATQTAALPPELQAYAVVARLMERNPGFNGAAKHKIGDGAVTELEFLTDNVADISPVRALTGLRVLRCTGSNVGKGKLLDLSPLGGLKLAYLDCASNPLTDLSPLKDMPLYWLSILYTPVTDLSALKDVPLSILNCGETKITDLSPLRGLNLKALLCGANRNLRELSPLSGMKLTELDCGKTSVTDLSPLKDVPLKNISCDFVPERDGNILRAIPTLEKINGKPAKVVLK
jgi:Leucine-rich repeat (LRR) protein